MLRDCGERRVSWIAEKGKYCRFWSGRKCQFWDHFEAKAVFGNILDGGYLDVWESVMAESRNLE